MSERLSCGHPVECVSEMLPDFLGDTPATQRIGTVYCRWCADIAQAEAKAEALMDALREYHAAAKKRRVRVKKLEEALRRMTPLALLDDRQRIAEIALGIPYYRKRGEEK